MEKNAIENSQQNLDKIESSKIVVLGNVDSSKSSSIGVLTKNVLDDGNGYARSLVTKIKHEQESGRTSTHSFHYIVKNNEITTLVDLCGHEKYLHTTMFGVMGLFCDYGLLMVGGERGVCGMTTEHMGLLISNKIPFIIVVSKIDICPANVMTEIKKSLERIAKRNKKELIYFEEEHLEEKGTYLREAHKPIIESFHESVCQNFHDRKTPIIPVIMTSNKTGYNVGFLREMITSIRSRAYLERKMLVPKLISTTSYPMIFYIDQSFNVQGIGLVLSGTLKYGTMHVGQKVYVGPVNNSYISVNIKSIHNCVSEDVKELRENESGSIGIRLDNKASYTRQMFSKGQIITSDAAFAMKNTAYSFTCDIAVFNHPTSIKNNFHSVLHIGTIRQMAKFIMDDEKVLRTGDRATIKMKFIFHPEFILPGTVFLFRDSHCKGIGRITSIVPFTEDSLDPLNRIKKNKKSRAERKKEKMEKNSKYVPNKFKNIVNV